MDLTRLGTYLVLFWNPIDFQGQRSRSPGQIFRRGDTPRFALPLLLNLFTLLQNVYIMLILFSLQSKERKEGSLSLENICQLET